MPAAAGTRRHENLHGPHHPLDSGFRRSVGLVGRNGKGDSKIPDPEAIRESPLQGYFVVPGRPDWALSAGGVVGEGQALSHASAHL